MVLLRIGRSTDAPRIAGNGVVVAVVDTGINRKHTTLCDRLAKDESDNVIPQRFFAGNGVECDEPEFGDPAGHGSHVAGIVSQAAPDVTLLSARVFGTSRRLHAAGDQEVQESSQPLAENSLTGKLFNLFQQLLLQLRDRTWKIELKWSFGVTDIVINFILMGICRFHDVYFRFLDIV
jgi:Subtilase family